MPSSSNMSSYLLPVIAFSSGILLGGAGVSLTKSSEKQQPTAIPQQPQQPSSPSLGKVEGSLVDSGVGSLKAGSILGPGGFPGPISDLLSHEVYLSSYDRRLRHASWTAEHLTSTSLLPPPSSPNTPSSKPDRSHSVFKEDVSIPPEFRSKLADYFRSGYDRGHLVPAADAKSSQKAMDQTFLLSNIAPQVGEGFNRNYWAHTEDFVRKLTGKFDDVWVFTVPLYLPKMSGDGKMRVTYEVIGNPPNVAVPTHFAKVILGVGLKPNVPILPPPASSSSSTSLTAPQPSTSFLGLGNGISSKQIAMTAFVLPNAIIPDTVPLRSFSVPVETVERSAGLTFFPPALKAASKHLCDLVSCDLVIRDFSDRNKQVGQQRRNTA